MIRCKVEAVLPPHSDNTSTDYRSFLDNTEEQIKDVTLLFNSFWYTKYTEALPSGGKQASTRHLRAPGIELYA